MIVRAIREMATAILNDSNRKTWHVWVGVSAMQSIAKELRAPIGARCILISYTGGELNVQESVSCAPWDVRFEAERLSHERSWL